MGLLILTVVILGDLGLLLWYWNRQTTRRSETLDAAGLNLPADPSDPSMSMPQPPSPAPSSRVPAAFTATGKPVGPPVPAPGRGAAGPGPRSGDAERTGVDRVPSAAPKALPRAVAAFLAMQQKSRFRRSNVIREWRRDFLSYPDLKEINRRYWRDKNALSFVVSTLRSPNFAKMVRRYAESPDVRDFAQGLLAAPGVMEVGRFVLADRSVMSAAKDLRLPGLPSVGELMAMGREAEGGASKRPARRR